MEFAARRTGLARWWACPRWARPVTWGRHQPRWRISLRLGCPGGGDLRIRAINSKGQMTGGVKQQGFIWVR
jgi:hypothetical protein